MRNKYFMIAISLLASLFIYLFYRTDKTLVNEIVIKMIPPETFRMIKKDVVRLLPLNNIIIYSLPEGLWVFCITLTSKPYYIRLGRWIIDCIYIPMVFCVTLELLQLFHITNGRFDFLDIGVSALFWLLGLYAVSDKPARQNILNQPNVKTIVCLSTYCIVYLAHVFK